jgi:hypothetical protein
MNQSASAKCEQTQQLIRFLKFVRNQVECFGLPARDILLYCERDMLDGCGFYNCNGDVSFELLARDCEIYDDVSARIMRDFLCSFGKSYRDEQIRECDRAIESLCERRAELFSELPKKKKLNSTVCITTAICLGILLA